MGIKNVITILSKAALVLFGTVLAVLWSGHASAQRMDNNRSGIPTNLGGNPFTNPDQQEENTESNKADTVKKKPRKPLESYFFDDSTRKRPNFVWNVDMSRNKLNFIEIDTALYLHQVDYEFLRDGVGDAYIGTLGGASIPLNYVDRTQNRNFSFTNAYTRYLTTPENTRFFNVKKPFTHLNYLSAGQTKQREENFAITNAQNASPSTGFSLDYKSRGTRGIYTWQRTRDKSLSLAMSHTGKKYTAHGGYIYNSIDLKENGGIINDKDITDTVFELPLNVPISLQDARNKIKNNTFFLVQSYGVPLRKLSEEDFSIAERSSLFIGHSFEYSRFSKVYTDTKDASGEFYKNWFINPAETRDSIFESLLSNKVFLQIQPWDRNGVIGLIDAGIGMDNHHYYQFKMDQYLSGDNKGENKTSIYVYGGIQGKVKKYFDWEADLQYHPFGYREQDINIGGKATFSIFSKDRPLSLSGSFRYDNRTPSYWNESYFSNHFMWSNSFAKENETRLEVAFTAPHLGVDVQAYQSVINNKVYYNADGMPAQYNGTVSVSGVYARKDFLLGGLHLNHRVLLQWSTAQEIIPVPLASAFLSYYFEFNIVKNVLRLQLGIDGRYNTEYYAFGYNPATAQFYNQRERQIGGYPMLDAFVNAKWKRMRILVKMAHINDNLIGGRNYFTALHYPQNKRILKLGFSWGFYD